MSEKEASPTFLLKEWLTLIDAAQYLSNVLGDKVKEVDLLRYARQKQLNLAVYFSTVVVKRGEIIRYPRAALNACINAGRCPQELDWIEFTPEEAVLLPDRPEEVVGSPVWGIADLKVDGDHYVKFPGTVQVLEGVWDLPMIGGEKLYIENKYLEAVGGRVIDDRLPLGGLIVCSPEGVLYQLQERFDIKEYLSTWDEGRKILKAKIRVDGIEKREAARLLQEHKNIRKQELQALKAVPSWERYRIATTFPKESILVIRRSALFEFVESIQGLQLSEQNKAVNIEQHNSHRTPCQPVTANQIRRCFVVKRDPDENEQWWKEKMGEAKRYSLLPSRFGAGKRGSKETLWFPHLIAGWLVDRHGRGLEGMDEKTAAAALRKFPGCEEIVDTFFI